MRFCIKTPVRGDYRSVMARFDKDLFAKLTPPGTPVKIRRFDGSYKGAIVHIVLWPDSRLEQEWISLITEASVDEAQCSFTDEGTKLPFFLSSWKHRHIVRKEGNDSLIVDDIMFRTPFLLMDVLMLPVMYLQFLFRKPVYKKFFSG